MSYTTVEERQREKIIELQARVAELEGARAEEAENTAATLELLEAADAQVLKQAAELERLQKDLACAKRIALEKNAAILNALIGNTWAGREVERGEIRIVIPSLQAEPQAKPCTGAEFVEAAQAAIQPRTDEEIKEILDALGESR